MATPVELCGEWYSRSAVSATRNAGFNSLSGRCLSEGGPTRTNDYEPLPKWRNAARRPSCQDAITLLRKQIEAKPLCQGTPTNILGYPSMIPTAAA